MFIQVVPYDQFWPSEFDLIKSDLELIIESAGIHAFNIEHVGSTAVPGMPARPVIDVDVVVHAYVLQTVIGALTSINSSTGQPYYEYKGDQSTSDRHLFTPWNPQTRPYQNIYLVLEGSISALDRLVIKDLCRRDIEARETFAQFKLDLSKRDWDSSHAYNEAKNEIFIWLLERAKFSQEDIQKVKDANTPTSLSNHTSPQT